MNFSNDKPIYLQIADHIKTLISKQHWWPGERIPSIRELALDIEVNPNTIAKTYNLLQEEGVIFNKRGLGYFVSEAAPENINGKDLKHFYSKSCPDFFAQMKRFNLSFESLKELYQTYLKELKQK